MFLFFFWCMGVCVQDTCGTSVLVPVAKLQQASMQAILSLLQGSRFIACSTLLPASKLMEKNVHVCKAFSYVRRKPIAMSTAVYFFP